MLPEERKRRVVELVTARDGCRVEELSAELDVSETTIRRDLDELDEQNRIERTHGGAMPVVNRITEYQNRSVRNQDAKQAIAERAVGGIHEGQMVAFDSGSTTLEVSRHVPEDLSFTAVTVHPIIAYELGETAAEVRLTGGRFEMEQQRLTGRLAERAIERLNFDLAFVGLEGIDETGLTTAYHDAARIKELLVASSKRVVAVADRTKFDSHSLVRFCDLSAVDSVVTDADVPQDLRARLDELDVTLIDGVRG